MRISNGVSLFENHSTVGSTASVDEFTCDIVSATQFAGSATVWTLIVVRLCKPGPCGRARKWARLEVDSLSCNWLLSNKWLGEVHSNLTKCTSFNRLLLSNQDKGYTPSLAHSLALPHGPGLLNISNVLVRIRTFKPTQNETWSSTNP